MTTFGCRYALSASFAIGLLAGCGGASSAPVGAVPQTAPQYRAHQASSGAPLIYAFGSFRSAAGLILDYPSGQVLNGLTLPFGAMGICSDGRGNVFVGGRNVSTNAPIIGEYPYAGTSLSGMVTIGTAPGEVRGCSVDNTTGNVAALIQYDQFTFAVAVLPQFTGTPQLYQDSAIYRFLSVGYDASGNLFLLGAGQGSQSFYLAELASGGSSFQGISLNLGSNATELHTVQWDGQAVTLEGGYDPGKGKPHTWPQAVYRLKISGSSATIAQTIKLKAFNKEEQTSWITPGLNALVLAQGKIRIFKYPAGGNVMKRLLTGQGPASMATVAVPANR
jgi:hypothetical protein